MAPPPCNFYRQRNGNIVILCGGGRVSRPTRCSVCRKEESAKLCDAPIDPDDRDKTCDRPLCYGCAATHGHLDACPRHTWWLDEQRAQATLPLGGS